MSRDRDMPADEQPDVVIKEQDEQSRDDSPSSIDSTGELAADALDGFADEQASAPAAPVQKRKGGRKPIYATSEERKQRNRQAQAAFRERRTEYIKQLETTIQRHEEALQNLQQSHRSAADECLMLRYKNSLLERILLEKGVDVQAELKNKDCAPSGRVPPPIPHPTPLHRPRQQRHMHRMSVGSSSLLHKGSSFGGSPQVKSSPSSQVSSPIAARSPTFTVQGGMNLAHPSLQAQQHAQQSALQSQHARSQTFPGISAAATRPGLQAIAPNLVGDPSRSHWPSPYRTHNEQLEQEYGSSSNDMMEDGVEEADEMSTGPGPYPQPFEQPTFSSASPAMQMVMPVDGAAHSGFGQIFDPSDPLLDADPFGLTASMHFPTPFSFNESSMRK